MSVPCSIQTFSDHLPATLADIESAALDVLFAMAIVNPNGPTLTFVAAVGESKVGADLPLVRVMLNPFSQQVDQVGRMRVGDVWSPLVDFEPLIDLEFGDCPTLVLFNESVPEANLLELTAKLLESFGPGVIDNFHRVRKYFGDPWTRVSSAMGGEEFNTDDETVQDCAQGLAVMLTDGRHVYPELQALLYAWEGSIEKTGIADALKRSAYQAETFKSFFLDQVLPTLWLPQRPQEEESKEPEVVRPQRLEINSLEELQQVLDSETWLTYDDQRFVDLLRFVLFVYGQEGDHQYIPHLGRLYVHGLSKGMDVETRMMLENEMDQLVAQGKVLPVVFLPFLVQDDDVSVTTKAAIDFVSSSGYVDSELYAFKELRGLFTKGALANRAAVFGALVAMGDSEVIRFAQELRPQLNDVEVRHAAQVHTFFPQHLAIQFWLGWCKELVGSRADSDLARFGSCASALGLVLRHARVQEVREGKRNFPCQRSEAAITPLRQWTLEEYAEVLAPDLYALEAAEESPRIFSHVLRLWGLQPRSPLDEQYIPDPSELDEPFRKLRDPGNKVASTTEGAQGFLGRLFKRK
jgi:hypothetical protein